MQRHLFLKPKITKLVFSLQIAFALLVAIISISSFVRLYPSGFTFTHGLDPCSSSLPTPNCPTSDQLASLLLKIGDSQARVAQALQELQEDAPATHPQDPQQLRLKHNRLLSDVMLSFDLAKLFLVQLKISGMRVTRFPSTERNASVSAADVEEKPGVPVEMDDDEERETDPLVEFFEIEEIRKYLRTKENRHKRKNFLGANGTIGAIGHACVSMKAELEQYMGYDVGDYCNDDWPLAQKLMVHGCDPLPRRRCLARAPPLYQKPFPLNESLWKLPDDRNVRWGKYACRNFQCLTNGTRKGFFKCAECFNLREHEAPRWVTNSTVDADFQIPEVLRIKPGEIRIGLDFSVGVGTFAARMLEHNVTIVSSTLNLGAPFNEMIALRGLIPLYVSVNQRLPFFDNTLDILHSTLFLDGWIDLQFLDFVVFDWDRVLRPGGLLWIDRFFCEKKDLDDYLYMFLQLRYKKHKWVVTPKLDKDNKEVYFSAVLEKPPRPF